MVMDMYLANPDEEPVKILLQQKDWRRIVNLIVLQTHLAKPEKAERRQCLLN